jgi:L-lactate dehydrogenase complex protein LldF
MPEWETLRELASGIKEHTLSHLADYLDQFITQAESNGVIVHYAATPRSTTRSSTSSCPSAA